MRSKLVQFAVLLALSSVMAIVHAADGQKAAAVVARYNDIPKGVVLEGTAGGIEAITSVAYNKDKNEFLINDKVTYKNPVDRKDFIKIYKSLVKDDRMGVTLIDGQPRVYGSIGGEDKIIEPMVETDKLFGGIIYGIPELLTVKLPGDYKPKVAKDRKIAVVAFTAFQDFQFFKNTKDNTYTRASCVIGVELIPLADKKTENGGHLPDEAKMKEYVMEDSDRANLDHLKTKQAEYLKIPCIGATAQLGEAAAFARWVRDSKVDSKEFLEKLK
jgi:hypothetical protein